MFFRALPNPLLELLLIQCLYLSGCEIESCADSREGKPALRYSIHVGNYMRSAHDDLVESTFPYWPRRDPITNFRMCQNCWNGLHEADCQHLGCECPCADHAAEVERHRKFVLRPIELKAYQLAGRWLMLREFL